ncbi:MAG: hypothetical protein EOP87_23640 [Verrucomicrobiaceae bacterium]|nr:MAG: hypothetical protein EOP87_23640 [Verrucomicrobiaceae bacterium]
MYPLHFPRALWAAAITLSIAPAVVLIIEVIERLARGRAAATTSTVERFVEDLPRITGIFCMLLMMVTVPMLLLWLLPATRRWFRRPWVAAIAGAVCGVLLTWPWMESFSLFFPFRLELTWERFIDAAPLLVPLAALPSSLYAFLHAFFINSAIAKKKWLEEHPEG